MGYEKMEVKVSDYNRKTVFKDKCDIHNDKQIVKLFQTLERKFNILSKLRRWLKEDKTWWD